MQIFRNMQQPESGDVRALPGFNQLSEQARVTVIEAYTTVYESNQRLGLRIAQGMAYEAAKRECETVSLFEAEGTDMHTAAKAGGFTRTGGKAGVGKTLHHVFKHPKGHKLEVHYFKNDPKRSTWTMRHPSGSIAAMGHEMSHLKHEIGKVNEGLTEDTGIGIDHTKNPFHKVLVKHGYDHKSSGVHPIGVGQEHNYEHASGAHATVGHIGPERIWSHTSGNHGTKSGQTMKSLDQHLSKVHSVKEATVMEDSNPVALSKAAWAATEHTKADKGKDAHAKAEQAHLAAFNAHEAGSAAWHAHADQRNFHQRRKTALGKFTKEDEIGGPDNNYVKNKHDGEMVDATRRFLDDTEKEEGDWGKAATKYAPGVTYESEDDEPGVSYEDEDEPGVTYEDEHHHERISAGDRVTIRIPNGIGRNGTEYRTVTGRAVMRGPHGWVLNIGGAHGTPKVASSDNIVGVQKAKQKKPDGAGGALIRGLHHEGADPLISAAANYITQRVVSAGGQAIMEGAEEHETFKDHTKNPYHKVLTQHGFVHKSTEHKANHLVPNNRDADRTEHRYEHPDHGKSHVVVTQDHKRGGGGFAYHDDKGHSWLHRHEQKNGIIAPSSGNTKPQLHRSLSSHYGEPKK
jgi:hypothetical protein